ncbi:MAG: CHASE2 domain-containing protein [Lachnospirales bacterium]
MKKIKIIVLLVFSLVLTGFISVGTFSFLENQVYDFFLRDSRKITNDVVIVGIDNESIDKIGRYPWDRDVYAKLIDNLTEGDAAAVGFDIIFSEVQGEEDYTLKESIEKNGSVVLATYADLNGELLEDEFLSANYFYYPNNVLLEASPHLGFINTVLESDNVVRRALPYIFDIENQEYKKSFNYKLYEIYANKNNLEMNSLQASYFERPFINYYGQSGSIETIPFYMALEPDIVSPEYFKNKIVLIGMTASGGEDIYSTPAEAMYGVEIHANFINNLLLNNYKTYTNIFSMQLNNEISFDLFLLIGCLISSAIYILISLVNKNNFIKTICAFVFIILYLFFVKYMFDIGYIIMFIYPIMMFVLLYLIDIIVDYFIANKEKKKITDIFSRYMSKDLVNKVVAEGYENMKLGGSRKFITVMFIDVRGFTTMSEALEPETVMSIINEYLSMASISVFNHKGLLDKYTGDGLMALFNVPYDLENHEIACVKAALEIQKNSENIYKSLYEKYNRDVKIGIGINCGDAIVGNIGSTIRMDYTAIGDAVNTAARLEANAKGGQILISEDVYNRIKDKVKVNPIGELSLKGKANTIYTYEVVNVVEE